MKTLLKKIEDSLVAITFAEAGEYDTAMEVLGEKPGLPDQQEKELDTATEAA